MTSKGPLIAIGGGCADPYRYFFDPIGMAFVFNEPQVSALWTTPEADQKFGRSNNVAVTSS